jgi:uncharacterized phage protein gp47/JayE
MEFTEHRLKQIRDSFNIDNTEGVDLDLRVQDFPLASIWRKGSVKASGQVMQLTLTRLDSTPNELIIPLGLAYKRADTDKVVYLQTSDITIDMTTIPGSADNWPVGETHKYPAENDAFNLGIRVIASQPGTIGNAVKDTITLSPDGAPAELVASTNNYPVIGGSEGESDQALRARARNYLSALSRITSAGLQYVAKTFVASDGTSWAHVSVYEPPDIKGYTEVIVDPGSGGAPWGQVASDDFTSPATKVVYTWPYDSDQPPYFVHEAPAVEDLTDDNVYLAGFWDGPDPNNLAGTLIYKPLSDPVIREMFGIPNGEQFVLSIGERGILYLNTDYKIEWANITIEKQIEVWGAYIPMADFGHKIGIDKFTIYTGAIAEFQAIIEGDPSDPVASPGYRPAGTRVRVILPTTHFFQGGVEVSLVFVLGYDPSVIVNAVKSELLAYAAGLAPGQPLFVAEMYDVIMDIEGVHNCTVHLPIEDVYPPSDRHSVRINPGIDENGDPQLKVY